MNALENRILPPIVALAFVMWLAISVFRQFRTDNTYNISLAVVFDFVSVAIMCVDGSNHQPKFIVPPINELELSDIKL